jgi:hypothetical protein
LSRGSFGKPSSLTMALSVRSMLSNWFCTGHDKHGSGDCQANARLICTVQTTTCQLLTSVAPKFSIAVILLPGSRGWATLHVTRARKKARVAAAGRHELPDTNGCTCSVRCMQSARRVPTSEVYLIVLDARHVLGRPQHELGCEAADQARPQGAGACARRCCVVSLTQPNQVQPLTWPQM